MSNKNDSGDLTIPDCYVKTLPMCAAAKFGRLDLIDNTDTLFMQNSIYFSNNREAKGKRERGKNRSAGQGKHQHLVSCSQGVRAAFKDPEEKAPGKVFSLPVRLQSLIPGGSP